jgi:hypothetical protein
MIDEYSGQGGSYLLDPETGKRTLIKRTLPADTPTTNGTSSSETTDSDRDGIKLWNRSDPYRGGRRSSSRSEHHATAE